MEHDLHQALAVAQVDKDHPAVIAPPLHPAGHRHARSNQLLIHLSAVMGPHRLSS
jgi:hypothetical protein